MKLKRTKKYYECHITFTGMSKPPMPKGWKFSMINGDPDLGVGTRNYLTKHFPYRIGLDKVIHELEEARGKVEDRHIVLRTKVELIVYDSRIK